MKLYFVQLQDWDGNYEESLKTAGEAIAWIIEQSRHRSDSDNKNYPAKIVYGEVVTPEQLNESALLENKETV